MENETQTEQAERLIADKACILFDRIEWGKNWSITILPPPPYSEAVIRDEKPTDEEKPKMYENIIDMMESVLNVAAERNLPDNFPCVLRKENQKVISIITIAYVRRQIPSLRKDFVVDKTRG